MGKTSNLKPGVKIPYRFMHPNKKGWLRYSGDADLDKETQVWLRDNKIHVQCPTTEKGTI